MPYHTGYAETESFLNTHIEVLFPDNSSIAKYRKAETSDLHPPMYRQAVQQMNYEVQKFQGDWKE